MITLGIETSCDETSVAVLKDGGKILSNVVSSSLARHQSFGGVVPEIASRHCLENIQTVFEEALRQARTSPEDLDLVAVTRGPGLVGSLLVGLTFGKALSYRLKIPFVGVNHLEGHLSANFIGAKMPERFIGLIVSGGHTELTFHQGKTLQILGSTVDDAIGEAYDKTAKLLGLGYPGGPVMDRWAQKGNPKTFRFTRPKQEGRFDFSFSGIKTAVRDLIKKNSVIASPPCLLGRLPAGRQEAISEAGARNDVIADVCASFQESVISWLVEKTIDACRFKKVKEVVVGGGVSANSRLRSFLQEEAGLYGIRVWYPPLALTSDNAAMIARRGWELYKQGRRSEWKLSADPGLKIGGI